MTIKEATATRRPRVYYTAALRDVDGRLICRMTDIQPPDPPGCLSFRCLMRWLRDSLFVALLSSYHARRIEYATRHRPPRYDERGELIKLDNPLNSYGEVLERYRTGEPSPQNIWQAIHANIKLKCPICRRYNVDPLLFRSKEVDGNGAKSNRN